jgi:hypothetical protein
LNRKLIFLNLVLLGLAGWLFWMLRVKWLELHQHEHTVLTLSPRVRQRLVIPPPNLLLKPPTAGDYLGIAKDMLFSKDRNSNVIVDPPPPPPPPPPPKPMPQLPAYYGTMALFGDPVILLSLPQGPQKKYHAGDKVGPFQLVSFDREKVVFDWDGKTVERKPEELKEKESVQQAQQQAEGPPTRVEAVKIIPDPPPNAPRVSEVIGADNGGGVRMCVAGDKTPPGTVIDGYKKVETMNMFGKTCMWQQVNP